MTPLGDSATRQYIDAVAAFEALEEARAEAAQVRGGMYWHRGPPSNPETSYLVRTSAAGQEKGMGSRSPETQAIFDAFTLRKAAAQERLRGLRAKVEEHIRLNRALRVGRVAPVIIGLLNCLVDKSLSEYFRVVGTHAMYAYEAAAGARFETGEVATQDIDLLWDVQRRVRFTAALERAGTGNSMLGVLKTVDATFRIRPMQRYTAVNKDGFEVDILRRARKADDPEGAKLGSDDDDFWVVQAERAETLMSASAFSAVIVATNGTMARMNTLHPLAFAEFKEWMSKLPEREGMKRRRDAAQAAAVRACVEEYLPQWKRNPRVE
jgi:hypothetical protein